MRSVTVSVAGAGNSSVIPMDTYRNPFNVGMAVTVASGDIDAVVQHTFDNVFDATVTPVWFDHPVLANVAANTDGNYAFPVTAIRVQNYDTGTAKLTVVQAGMPGE